MSIIERVHDGVFFRRYPFSRVSFRLWVRRVEVVRILVGCDQRSELQNWCAGAGNRQSLLPTGSLADLRVGTPQSPFSPLVTPYS
jgi:hypothetical protein